uniref:Uncharacterized protein n=1 Tax=Sinocyclocheilus rhinocerous TaxID=307959 RepID=A0A673GI51_9TELE
MRFKDGQIPCEVNSDTSADISHLCDIAADPLVKSLRLHSDAVLCLASDDQYILSGSKDQMHFSVLFTPLGDNRGLLHTFSMHNSSLTPISQFSIRRSLVTGVHYSPGAVYTCSSDRTIKVHLPCAPPKKLCTLHHQAGVNGVC